MVPVWPVGPSWSVWPSITDFIVPAMLLCLPFLRAERRRGALEVITIKRLLLLTAGGAIVSYLGLTLNLLHLKTTEVFNDKGQNVGLYKSIASLNI